MKRAVTMANVRKALRFSLKGKDYDMLDSKENDYFSTPKYLRRTSDTFEMTESERKVLQLKTDNAVNSRRSLRLTRSTSVTTSFRDAMGSLKQKIRKSTRRRMRLKSLNGSPETPGALRRSYRLAGKNSPIPLARSEVKLIPFTIETPPHNKRVSFSTSQLPSRFDYETPGRIRREVEALTHNMQALATLTPRTLRSRSSRNIITVSTTTTSTVSIPPPTFRPHKSPSPVLLTNGSLRPDVQARRRLQAKTPIFV